MSTNMVLLRDESGEAVMKLVERDAYGRFCRSRYQYIWVPDAQAKADADAQAQWETDGGQS